jgi:hypothetical protein
LCPGGRFAFTVWAVPDEALAFGMVLNAVRTLGNPEVPLPPGPPFFRYSDAATASRAMEDAGFADVEARRIAQSWHLADEHALFGIMCDGTARTGALLRGQTDAARSAIRAALAEESSRFREGDRVIIPMPAVLTCGRKPAA